MKHILYLPDYTPVSLNEFANKHWSVRKSAKDSDRQLIAHYVDEQGIPEATTRRKVTLYVVLGKGQRKRDNDNCWKVLLDSLVSAGVLKDDSPKWCIPSGVHWSRGERRDTFVVLEDVE